MKKYPGISRIDSGATHGWFVRAYRNGKTHSKFFSDLKNKGKGKALALALAYRDELRARLGPPAPTKRVMKKNSGNTSGVIGVSLTKRRNPSGKLAQYYTASWRPEPNVAKNKSFSINVLGKEKAFQMAVKFRKKCEKEILAKFKNQKAR